MTRPWPGLHRRTAGLCALGALSLIGCGGQPDDLCKVEDTTAINVIQGSGERSPQLGRTVTVRGIVTLRLEVDDPEEAGFFLQAAADQHDDDPATSEGLFVLSPEAPRPGARIAVRGPVAERGENAATATTLLAEQVSVCNARGQLPAPVVVNLPADLEAVENMRVTVASTLTVSGAYALGRWGQLRVAAGGQPFQPTGIAEPGGPARAVASRNAQRMLLIDDGSEIEYPTEIAFLPQDIGLKNIPRAGDTISGLTGVVDRRDFERLHASDRMTPETKLREPRFTPPPGNTTVAAFNLLNYFNGDGLGGGFPTPRGANSREELERQEAKLVATVLGLGLPDILAVQELENDGFGDESALAQFTGAINARIRSPRTTYDFVRLDDERIGTDDITVGILYRRDKVTPVGTAATTAEGAFADFNRQPLAQSFENQRTGQVLTVVALHLKSKSCRNSEGLDTDQGDGQGCYNPKRTAAAAALLEWIETRPTGIANPDVLLVGDFNAYTREAPLTTLEDAGYVNLVQRFNQAPIYTFIYRGVAGSLDHAYASPSLAARASGARVWHINAAYPAWLDYNLEGKPGEIGRELYTPSAVRSSDHDPLVVGLR